MSQTTHFLVLSLHRKPEIDAYAGAKQLFCCYYSVIDELHIQNNAYLKGVLKAEVTQERKLSLIASWCLRHGVYAGAKRHDRQAKFSTRQLCVPCIEQLTKSRFIQITSVKIGAVYNYKGQLYLQAAMYWLRVELPVLVPRLGCGGYSLIFARNWSFGYIQNYSFCLKTISK